MSVMEIMDAAAPTHVAHRDNHTHRDVNGGWLRPAVFGAMDGLVSNLALMTGVAGGALSQQTIIITGLAGLAAGAFSMAAGEYTSVASQRELVQAELDIERSELRKHPEDELDELAALYVSRGVEPVLARRGRRAAVPGPRAGPGDPCPRGVGHRPVRPSFAHRRRALLLRILCAGRAAACPSLSAGGVRHLARGAARAGRTVRLRGGRGAGDGALLVVQRTAPAGPRRRRGGCDVRPGSAVRNRRRVTCHTGDCIITALLGGFGSLTTGHKAQASRAMSLGERRLVGRPGFRPRPDSPHARCPHVGSPFSLFEKGAIL